MITTAVQEQSILPHIRRILLGALWLGTLGTVVELLLLEHYEEWRQIVPLALLGSGLLVLAWHAIARGAAPLHVLQVLMMLYVLGGAAGMLLHYRGNVEFELEMYPDRRGLALFRESMMGATPALAPGTLIQLGLVGLAYSYRHPRLARSSREASPPSPGGQT